MDRQSAQPPDIPRPTGSYEHGTSGGSSIVQRQPGESPDWFDLEHTAGATLLKRGRHRKTWRVTGPNLDVVVKVFDRRESAWDRLTDALRIGDPALREYRALQKARQRGVRVNRPIAHERDRRRGRTALIVEAIPYARSLIDAWTAADAGARRRLIVAVARSLANAHEQGMNHCDLHPENLLVHGSSEAPLVTFVDLLGVKFSAAAVRIEAAVQSLAQLDQSFHRLASRTDRLRFVHVYLRYRALDIAQASPWARMILAARIIHAEKLARQRDRRLRGDGTYFAAMELGEKRRALVALKLERRHVFPEAGTPDRTVDDWRRELAEIREGESKLLAIEKFRAGGNAEGLAWRLFGSPARKAFENVHRRRHRDEPAELVLGYVERRCPMGLIAECWILRPKR